MGQIRFRFLIFLIYFTYINSIVVFPFKISESKEQTLKLSNDIHATTYFGDSKQLTDIFFTSEDYLYFLDTEECIGEHNFIKNFSTYTTSPFSIMIEDEDDYMGKTRAYQVNETIYFYKDLDMTELDKVTNFPFLIKEKNLHNQQGCLLLGILYRTKKDILKREINFIEQLKKNKIITSYSWTFKFNNEYEGLFIIGDEPHNYDPLNYNGSNFIQTLPPIDEYPSAYCWNISFEKAYSGDTQFDDETYNRFAFSINFFLGNSKYNKTIFNQFFKKYIDDKKCSFNNKGTHSYYYCDKNKFKIEDINKFPPLSLLNIRLEMNFSFTGEDLFYEEKDYYYFRVYFMESSPPGWLIGQPFLRKYQLVFNYDSKTIGFYNNWRKEKNNNDDIAPFFSYDSLYLLIPVAIIIFTFIIFALTKFVICDIVYNKKRKKLLNELEDENAEYFDIEGKNKDNNNPDDKKLYKTIE